MSHKKIRRAAIRYQNSQARRGNYIPSIEEAIQEVLKLKMTTKKLQPESKYNEYDEDGDGIVSDSELAHVKEIKETELL